MPNALIVEDDHSSRDALAEWAGREGFEVTTAGTLEDARKHLEKNAVQVVIIDLMLPDGEGTDLVQELESIPNVEVLIITGHGTVDSAVTALKGGAIDYLTKPIDLSRLQKNLAHIREKAELRNEVVELRGELRRLGRFGSMIGASQPMQTVYDLIARVAPTDATVLITGETGTGKELVARSVHELSTRSRKAFLPINCGAVSPTLIESELFGHERGSFTGADRQRKGVFERAHAGTLFLDEITEMPAELQVKLLRVLETGIVTRVGGEDSGRIDVRVIGATNRNPEEAVENGRLRRDLLYRLNVFPIHVPPLRDRGGDIEMLAAHFLEQLNATRETAKTFSAGAIAKLRSHSWPGNVRELKNVVERAYIISPARIDAEHIPADISVSAERTGGSFNGAVGISVAEAERRLILATLDQFQGDKKAAAKVLGVSLKTLYNKIKTYGRP